MPENNNHLFTIGEFAKKAGTTLRTLRYYDNIGLLKPTSVNNLGHRFYTKEDFAILQKILTLKFIGLSLDDISDVMKYDLNDKNLKNSLEVQKDILQDKIKHMKKVFKALDDAVHTIDVENILDWNKFINIINVINIDTKWIEQYKNASNLKSRIKIHERYSTNKEGWMPWFFSKLSFPKNASVLELGCGDGSLWKKNISSIPEDLNITITDFSSGMLEDAKKNLGNNKRFNFKVVNAEHIPFDDEQFDVVIANHMLYHINDKFAAFSEIKRVLKTNGCFYASTVGKNHMKEMRDIVKEFNSEDVTTNSFNITESFQLENGLKQVSKWFNDVTLNRYEDSLFLKDSLPLVDYIFSMPGNGRKLFTKDKLEFLTDFINNKINETGGISITKDTGFFKSTK